MNYDLQAIIKQFQLNGKPVAINPTGNGHINDTFKITMESNGTKTNYILQRINQYVFKKPEELMSNMIRVTEHIRKKVLEQGENADERCINLYPALDGKKWYLDPDGNYWRLYRFVENAIGYETAPGPEIVYEAGKAIGQFQSWLADIPGGPMYETIPFFNHPVFLVDHFKEVLEKDSHQRAASAKEIIDLVLSKAYDMQKLYRLGEAGLLPLRISHNDTKINNILMDPVTNEAICIIDLDTIMSGFALNDFGDSVRTSCNQGAEDDPDLDNVKINLENFEAFTKGYLSKAKSFLTPVEVENLAFSAMLYPFLIGLRFITDYLDGDCYFKIHHENHNLQRAKAQFKLMQDIEANLATMEGIVKRIYNE